MNNQKNYTGYILLALCLGLLLYLLLQSWQRSRQIDHILKDHSNTTKQP